jgi:hypothetical protein
MHHRCQKLMVHKMHPTPDHAGLLRLRFGAGWAWMRLSNSAGRFVVGVLGHQSRRLGCMLFATQQNFYFCPIPQSKTKDLWFWVV